MPAVFPRVEGVMRAIRMVGMVAAVGLGYVATTTATGCFNSAADCEERLDCMTGGTDGGPDACIPSKSMQPVADTCGVFVSSRQGAKGAMGTKSTPVKTLAEALSKANGRPV